ncbi:MAG: hypothetical protein ACOC3Z_00755 [Nanoarchaeota archaeon]
MPEIIKKKIIKKKTPKKKISNSYSTQKKQVKKKAIENNNYSQNNNHNNTEKLLIENFASLQKVMVNLSSRFDELSNQISKLLNLFEVSAQALAKRNFDLQGNNQELVNKLNNLAEQNKVIARGVSLLHEENNPSQQETNQPPQQNYPPQMQPPQPRGPPQQNNELRRSISQRDKNIPPHKEIHRAITDNRE